MNLQLKKTCLVSLDEVKNVREELSQMDAEQFDNATTLRARIRQIETKLLPFEKAYPEVRNILAPIGMDLFRHKDRVHWLTQLEAAEQQLEYWLYGEPK